MGYLYLFYNVHKSTHTLTCLGLEAEHPVLKQLEQTSFMALNKDMHRAFEPEITPSIYCTPSFTIAG